MALVVGLASPLLAQRDLAKIPDPDPEIEHRSFEVADGFEVSLYAADPLIAKPIHMNFDAQGRLWIASSTVYPQVKPGEEASDKILVVSDRDGDGTAEMVEVFADGLLIPTGVLPGDGGVYVANSTELLHFSDTDGDARADKRRVVLSGFGTEDTHHLLHTLRWGPDGLMYMNQSIYIHSHIETPYGVRRMNGGGTWFFRPETLELDTFMLGLVNHWGHVFDAHGQSLMTDGAGFQGINFVFPGFVGMTSPGAKRIVDGLNPGEPKYCGLEIISGRHFPPEWVGNLITNDFRANRVSRFVTSDDGSGFAADKQPNLITSSHVAFRPIDVKLGPDGALYIADWYNPIIQHGEVDFRDERRDHTHGRIWRVTAKGRPLVERPNLVDATTDQLLENFKLPEQWTRMQSRMILKERGFDAVGPKLAEWTKSLPDDSVHDSLRLESLWTYQALNTVNEPLLLRLLESGDFRVRAAATRVVYHWHAGVTNVLDLLADRIVDVHPRVRLEASRALSRVRKPEACEIAMRAVDMPMDRFLDFALWLTARDLESAWLPAFEKGELDFGKSASQMTFALNAVEAPNVVPLLLEQLTDDSMDEATTVETVSTIGGLANADQLAALLSFAADTDRPPVVRTAALDALAEAAEQRATRPVDVGQLDRVFECQTESVKTAACRVAGSWQTEHLRTQLYECAFDASSGDALREQAMLAIARLGGDASAEVLMERATEGPTRDRLRAARALAQADVREAARITATILSAADNATDPSETVAAIVRQRGGVEALSEAIADSSWPTDIARRANRTVRSTGRDTAQLVAAISKAGRLDQANYKFTPENARQWLARVGSDGDPTRGEAVYRRGDLICQKCHAIGGSGGQVGPDLSSVGASAQADYLIEALLDPKAKVKENYHSVTLFTDDGRILGGIKRGDNKDELTLRTADDELVRVPRKSIEEIVEAGSLMPEGLVDGLTDQEFVDLIAFLDAIGTSAEFSVPNYPHLRRWEFAVKDKHPFSHVSYSRREQDLSWQTVYSRANGTLAKSDLPTLRTESNGSRDDIAFARFRIVVTQPGTIRFAVSPDVDLIVPIEIATPVGSQRFAIKNGTHTLFAKIMKRTSAEPGASDGAAASDTATADRSSDERIGVRLLPSKNGARARFLNQ